MPAQENIDLLDVYAQQVKPTPLINAEQEVTLSQRIQRGIKAKGILNRRFYRSGCLHFKRLEQVAADGLAAKQALVSANLRFAISVARYYFDRCDLELLDLIQEANMGLINAADRFDPNKGRFVTYAKYHIRQAITYSITKNNRHKTQSLDQQIGNSRADPNAQESMEKEVEQVELEETVQELLSKFPLREKRALTLSFGLRGNRPLPIERVAEEMGLSRSLAGRLVNTALNKLKTPEAKKILQSYL